MIVSQQTNAAYLGLGITHQTVNTGGALRSVFRVYAVFNNPDDYLTSGAGSAILGPLNIQSRNVSDTGPGSNFYNPGGSGAAGNLAPSSPDSPNYWGTYVTIGISDATQGTGGTPDLPADETGLSPGFPNFINGTQLVSSDMAWFTAGATEQGRAGHWGTGTFVNGGFILSGYGVQLMQLTVNAGSRVKGTLAIGVDLAGGVAGGQSIGGQTFSAPLTWPPPPAPGALSAFTIAAMFGPRRRRTGISKS